ncbi:hypothetical protein S7711_05244 [Stachybotrys chartarum IBT 7711]|uniref:tRNA wybutosine-synthesizing protein 4 n=1 Tax=Stachybotrys chartarum (strain CBS 109288 / IBT 7711) TaxID=1280523 RepID=A0A084AGJ6_STACB|nr:hypothetical protein S7711_05244 [Stachybotrys chartarum IBT 7711]KFA45530.1 hypothetical protein S40293_08734 [Stachybotrys chartarum IBT 40293]
MAATTPAPMKASRSQVLDDLIMGTNSSSIVSKRSVERLYYPNEPHYFRYFVKKFQRRAPLINRGYWLRLRAIDVIVRQFLSRPSTAKKVVINLGCGSDVLPWQCHARYPSVCDDALFIDVDYPDLIKKKRAIVLETPDLKELLGQDPFVSTSDSDSIILRSEKYCQVACDLRRLSILRQSLETLVSLPHCNVLFVAEVSITYMDTASADALLEWASSIGQAEFCLLEQILPQGPEHPFAQTMLKHFDKLSTPPRSVGSYPTTESQRARFQARGWAHVDIWDLWHAWSGSEFVSPDERAALDIVEPFDEWEEFILFARHYFILHAVATEPGVAHDARPNPSPGCPEVALPSEVRIATHEIPGQLKRRFGGAVVIRNPLGEQHVVNMLGLGTNGRADSCDIVAVGSHHTSLKWPENGPTARMCFTVTDLGELGVLVVGGRSSPTHVFSDCWLLEKGMGLHWKEMPKLPVPLFRHSSVRLRDSFLTLVMGGKTSVSSISPESFVFYPGKGWLKCDIVGARPEPTFGAMLCNLRSDKEPGSFRGLVSGGIDNRGLMNTQAYVWELVITESKQPTLSFKKVDPLSVGQDELSVFGAHVVELGNLVAVCGGLGHNPSNQGQEITFISLSIEAETYKCFKAIDHGDESTRRPFMVGTSIVKMGNDELFVVGGGATCFSMGTFWQTDIFRIVIPKLPSLVSHSMQKDAPANAITCSGPHRIVRTDSLDAQLSLANASPSITAVPRIKLNSEDGFLEVLRERSPVVIEGLNLGDCLQKWNPDHLIERVGSERKVVVHECLEDTAEMDFNSKNFCYTTEAFGVVMDRMCKGERLYLRSLSQAQPSELPASLESDFPTLADEFSVPPEMKYVRENCFSSVLRISGRVNMWLHYDVMANIYAQIQGSKKMILFPPSEIGMLSFPPAASSSSLDVFSLLESPSLAGTHPCEANLMPGDVLFLPPMWLHTAKPETALSIAVNTFFRDLDGGYSAGRDVYGNRDLAAYEKGRVDVARIARAFQSLPADIRRFYLSRLGKELVHFAEDS